MGLRFGDLGSRVLGLEFGGFGVWGLGKLECRLLGGAGRLGLYRGSIGVIYGLYRG